MQITRALTLTSLLLAAALGVLAGACASTPDATATTASATHAEGCMMPDSCPMQVEGTTVSEVDVDGGASLVFVTTGDVAVLRDRVTKMAAMHQSHAAGGGMGGMGGHGAMSPGMKMGMGKMGPMPAATATATDSEGGATLTLTATDGATLEALREHVRARATHMQSGACAMKPRA
jgi:hypothetical protein